MNKDNIDYSKIYSYSKLNLFNKCKKQYYFSYLDPEVSPIKKQFIKPRDYKTKGQAVHGAITLFYHLPVEERTFEKLKDCLSKAWFSEIDIFQKPPIGKLGGFSDLEHERRVYRDALEFLKNFFDLGEIELPIFYLPTKEIRNSFNDYKQLIKSLNSEFSISGKFDRIDKLEDGNLRIIDFKTSKDDQDRFQLEFYKILAELNFNTPVKTVSFYYLDKGKILDLDISDIEPEEIKNQILEKIKSIKNAKEFLPRATGLCGHCDFLEICPEKSRFLKQEPTKQEPTENEIPF